MAPNGRIFVTSKLQLILLLALPDQYALRAGRLAARYRLAGHSRHGDREQRFSCEAQLLIQAFQDRHIDL